MPTKRLPNSANLDHLKRQAKDLLRDFRAGDMAAYQRVREFHPKLATIPDAQMPSQTFALSDAQLSIAREYGYASWPRLKGAIAENHQKTLTLTHNDRLPDGPFKQALDFMDAGDEARLSEHLTRNPGLVQERAYFEGDNYFRTPSLLEFLPENPTRLERMPTNAVAIAEILLSAGAQDDLTVLDETLMLTASGRICREAGVQSPLLRLLCAHGADPATAMHSALAHAEVEAARTLIDCGAPLDLAGAATLDDRDAVKRLLPDAEPATLQLALSLAASAGRCEVVKTLLAAGADPNRYNPPGSDSHCTPLHSAVAGNRVKTVIALVESGADTSMLDIHHKMTPLGWAQHLKHQEIADYLSARP